MKMAKNLPVYVLSGALVLSSIIYANTAQSATQYVTSEKYKSEQRAILLELARLDGKISNTSECLTNTTIALTQSRKISVICP